MTFKQNFIWHYCWGKIFNEERVVTRADGTRDWKTRVTREQKLEYNL